MVENRHISREDNTMVADQSPSVRHNPVSSSLTLSLDASPKNLVAEQLFSWESTLSLEEDPFFDLQRLQTWDVNQSNVAVQRRKED